MHSVLKQPACCITNVYYAMVPPKTLPTKLIYSNSVITVHIQNTITYVCLLSVLWFSCLGRDRRIILWMQCPQPGGDHIFLHSTPLVVRRLKENVKMCTLYFFIKCKYCIAVCFTIHSLLESQWNSLSVFKTYILIL